MQSSILETPILALIPGLGLILGRRTAVAGYLGLSSTKVFRGSEYLPETQASIDHPTYKEWRSQSIFRNFDQCRRSYIH